METFPFDFIPKNSSPVQVRIFWKRKDGWKLGGCRVINTYWQRQSFLYYGSAIWWQYCSTIWWRYGSTIWWQYGSIMVAIVVQLKRTSAPPNEQKRSRQSCGFPVNATNKSKSFKNETINSSFCKVT